MLKHYFTRSRGVLQSLAAMLCFILLSGTGQVFGQFLNPVSHPKFQNQLPVVKDLGLRIDATAGGNFNMTMKETTWPILGAGYPETPVWGYGFKNGGVTYPGPTFVTQRDVPITVTWHNELPETGHLLPVDVSLHMAHPHDMSAADFYGEGNIPAVVHLHGGHTESASDGLPEAWFTQGFDITGPQFKKQKYTYHNDQEAATLWYHDHALGITRLNVYAGLAGFYLLRDDNEMALINDGTLPGGDYEIEIVIQDRMFYDDGELFLPAISGDPWFGDEEEGPLDPPFDPSIVAEFFGDFIVVNGNTWPNLNVEQRKYRFRLLNGSDSRFYVLKFSDGTPFLQIGTDNGLIESPVIHNQLTIAPGERYDVVVDFSNKPIGSQIIIQNTGPDEPFKGNNFNNDVTRPTGQIMRFTVNQVANPTIPNATVDIGTSLRPPIVDHPTTGVPTRQLVLFEGEDEYGRLQPLLGTMNEGSLSWFEPITENPALNAVEIWEVYNSTEDAHPIHLHLVSFQIINRESFTGTVVTKDQAQHNGVVSEDGGGLLQANTVQLLGDLTGPGAQEDGWKDTFIVPPGKVGRVVARFDRPGRYVWHCHILSHEDHEMMRPFYVGDIPRKAGQFKKEGYVLEDPSPNPIMVGQSTNVGFEIPKDLHVTYKIYDSFGNFITSSVAYYEAGEHTIIVPGMYFMAPGDYIFTFYAGDFFDFTRIKVR